MKQTSISPSAIRDRAEHLAELAKISLPTIGRHAVGSSVIFDRLRSGRITLRNAARLRDYIESEIARLRPPPPDFHHDLREQGGDDPDWREPAT